MLAMGPQDLLPVSRATLEKSYDELIADPSIAGSMKSHYRCKDGSLLPFESTRHVLRSGERWLIAAISRDVRQRLAAEEALRESEERFRSLTKLSSDWFWQTDAEHRFVNTPDRVTQLTGMTSTSYVGKRRWEVAGLSPVSGDWTAHREVLRRRESFRDLELVQVKADGGRAYLQVSGEPVFASDSSFQGYRGTARDITARKREEEELRRFRAAMDMSFDAIYLVDRSTMRFVDVNEAGCRGVGYSREELLRMGPHQILDVPLESLARQYDAVIAEGERGTSHETSYLTKGGRRRWTELHRRALRTGEGWIIVTISRDITERKSAEERKAAHLRYQERIARFGQSALAKREAAELIGSAVQEVLEGLGADAVAYVEPEGGGLVLRAVVGVAMGAASGTLCGDAASPLVRALESGTRQIAGAGALPLAWARDLQSAAFIPVRGERGSRGVLCALYARPDAFGPEEINFVEAGASVLSTGLQRIASDGRLAYLAQFDALTGLPNRALLADRFSQMIAQARRHAGTLGALFIDLDEFKMVNDTLGHAGGDELLKEVAVRLQACVRAGDTVARISGDEFAVVLADLARAEDAAIVAQKIIERLAAAVEIHGQEVFVTASVGIALFPTDGDDAEGLIGAADAAMYRAKESGRNAFQFFTAEINQRSRARAQLGHELRRALEREEFALAYQPKIRLADGEICGAEALLRWRHPERGIVSPAEFIPVLEETGLIVPAGEWVLRRACLDMRAWREAGLASGAVAVNLSARQFRLPDLDQRIKALVAEVGLDPRLLELEITESQLMQDPNHAIRVMRSLRDAGISIAIDDFGTGYSSLAYLTRFPLASLKIDRSFVSDVKKDAQDATIVRTIIEMAHTLGFTVVAEGIENEYQAQYLRSHGCEQGQGFLFARPMPAAEFRALVAQGLAAAGRRDPQRRRTGSAS
jgi:diguanylate cyclase (GGDEF)-like protein/PAS domain S-box-containing protein